MSRHRDGMELHYGRDDFADRDRLIRTLSRDRAKDMASDYDQRDPAQGYAERCGIAFRARAAEIVRKLVPERLRGRSMVWRAGRRQPGDAAPGPAVGPGPEREKVGTREQERQAGEDPENALRRARRQALIRHARASDAILEAKRQGAAPSDEQRRAFDAVRPCGWQDAEAAYSKDNSLAREAGSGNPARAIRALQIETELRLDPAKDPNWRADRFVGRFRELRQAGERQYAAGNYSGYRAAREEMGDMARSLERDPQMESLLAGRKRKLGISMDFDPGMRLGQQLAFSHGFDFDRGRGLGL